MNGETAYATGIEQPAHCGYGRVIFDEWQSECTAITAGTACTLDGGKHTHSWAATCMPHFIQGVAVSSMQSVSRPQPFVPASPYDPCFYDRSFRGQECETICV